MESTNKVESRSSERNLAGRVALVTGGSRGIGRATCLALASRGAAVAVLCRSRIKEAQEVFEQIQSIGARGLAMEANVLDPEAIKRSAREAVATLGRIDILVNNAGEMTDVAVVDMKDEVWEQALAINLTSAFRYARECIPAMKERRWWSATLPARWRRPSPPRRRRWPAKGRRPRSREPRRSSLAKARFASAAGTIRSLSDILTAVARILAQAATRRLPCGKVACRRLSGVKWISGKAPARGARND